jgi:Protein of unknown function (DUF2911)
MSLVVLVTLTGLLSTGTSPSPLAYPDTSCQILNPDRIPAQGRKSPLDSLTFTVAKQPVKLCYGRPASRGRVMLGGTAVPYGKLWRTGANEPTIFFNPVPITLAGIRVPPGKYSLYSVPGEKQWEIIVNRSTSQWGEESNYTDKVKAQEVGRGKVPVESVGTPVENFTIKADPATGEAKALVLEWEKTRVRIPVSPS